MKNVALVSALLAGTVAAVSPGVPLVARQESIPCEEIEMPVVCCSDGYLYCELGEYCTNGGCCPVGRVCSGPAPGTDTDITTRTDTDIITRTDSITNTFTVPDTSTPTEPPVDCSETPSMPSAPSSIPSATVPEVPTSSPSDVVPPVPTQSPGAAPNTVRQGSIFALLSGLAAFLI